MTIVGFLPRRWRPSEDIARHAEAVAGVLQTSPLERSLSGTAIISLIGTADVLPYLVAIKSLRRRLGPGRIAIVDDGTLTGEDRAILAHHCGDPEILRHQAVRRGSFPAGGAWAMLLTVLDRRGGQYWIALDPHTVTLGPVPEIETAVASNRSFSLDGGCAGITGFAAGAAGRTLASSFAAQAADAEPGAADAAMFILENEPNAVRLTGKRYASWTGKRRRGNPALIHFPAEHRFTEDCYASVSAAVTAGFTR